MLLTQLIDPRLVRCQWEVKSKKQLLQAASETISQQSIGVDAQELFNCITRREKLGSTALGLGAAIPHCRSSICQKVTVFFASLAEPIAYDAADLIGVDLVFVLLVPGNCSSDHVELLEQLSQLITQPETAIKLREASSDMHLYTTLIDLCEHRNHSAINQPALLETSLHLQNAASA